MNTTTLSESEKALASMTPRTLEVFQLEWDGLTAKEIADELLISTRTVEWHFQEAKVKLQPCNGGRIIAKKSVAAAILYKAGLIK